MASISRDTRTNSLSIYFRLGGKVFKRSLKTDDEREAKRVRVRVESNLARSGIDQRVIDELIDHETEAMRKRYRHLFPDQTQDAVRRLFG